MATIEEKYETALLMLNAFMHVSNDKARDASALLAGMVGAANGMWKLLDEVAKDAGVFANSAKWRDAIDRVAANVRDARGGEEKKGPTDS